MCAAPQSGLAKRSPAVPATRLTCIPHDTLAGRPCRRGTLLVSTRKVSAEVPPRPTVPRAELTEMADSREREMAGWTVPAPQRVVFCNNCGTLMEEPTFANTNVLCRMCGTVTPSKGAALASLTTNSRACARLTRLPLRSI